MAHKHKNEKGFLVIRTEQSEITCLGGLGICDDCNQKSHTGYLIAVLNRWFCDKCFTEWYNRAKYYKEDRHIEKRTFEYYKSKLELKEE